MELLVQVIEILDAVGHSKDDFKVKGLGIGNIWVRVKTLNDLIYLADALGVKFIFKIMKRDEFFFKHDGVVYYFKA